MTPQHNSTLRFAGLNMVWPLTAYLAIALAVLLPLLKPGFVLTLDMVFTPELRMPEHINNGYIFYTLLHLVNSILPGDVIQKLLLLAVFVLAGYGMHRLARALAGGQAHPIGLYAAGLLYAVNPFTYDRLMAGQYGVLLGYALLPFFVKALLALLGRPSSRRSVAVALWAGGLAVVSIHALGYMAVLAAAGLGLWLWRNRHDAAYRRNLLRFGLAAVGIFVAVSCYWLVPLALGKGSTAAQIARFGVQDSTAFATAGGNVAEQVANVIRLQGFWQEERGLYLLPQTNIPAWGLIALMIWIIVAVGMVHAWRAGYRAMVAFVGLITLLGIILSTGVGLQQASTHLSFLAGFREPQKFAVLVALGYAIGLSWGAAALIQAARNTGGIWFARLAGVVLVAVPVIFTSVLFWGARGQLSARQYPQSWYAANDLLNGNAGQSKTLFLPWHLYMYYGFTGRLVASPAPFFFDKPVLVSDDPEFAGAGAANTSPAKQAAGRLLKDAEHNQALATDLARQDIKYVLLAREDDFERYDYLNSLPGLERVYQSPELDVYRNHAYKEAGR